jgi:hypothetical protein
MHKVSFETPHDPHYEVEWLDQNGDGHHVTFTELSYAMEFVETISLTSMMIAVYRIWKETL